MQILVSNLLYFNISIYIYLYIIFTISCSFLLFHEQFLYKRTNNEKCNNDNNVARTTYLYVTFINLIIRFFFKIHLSIKFDNNSNIYFLIFERFNFLDLIH